MKLTVHLPRDRELHGSASLIADSGAVVLAGMDARGKADSSIAEFHKNPKRDPTLPYGDTPYGVWHSCRVQRIEPPKNGLGDAWIPLDKPFSGDAVKAKINGRTGLGIHAGRGNNVLTATKGCVRLRDRDFAALAHALGGQEFDVEITAPEEPGKEEKTHA